MSEAQDHRPTTTRHLGRRRAAPGPLANRSANHCGKFRALNEGGRLSIPVHSSRMRRRFGNRPDEGILVQRFWQMELKPAAEALGLMLL